MIQRKQTLLLAFAAILLILLFLFPLYKFEKDGEDVPVFIYGARSINLDFFALVALTIFSIFIIIAVIFLYKNRKRQMLLCKIATLLLAGLITAIFYFIENLKKAPEFFGVNAEMQPALVAPLLTLLLVIVSNRLIKKDEELVRSADRLR